MALHHEILADNPRAYWRFNNPDLDLVLDSSGNVLTLVTSDFDVMGAAPIQPDNTYSGLFSGSNYASRADHNLLDLGDSFTLEAFVKRDPAGSGNRTIIDKGTLAYGLRINGSNQLELTWVGVAIIVTSTIALSTNPHHVVATKNGGTVRLYIDGVDRTGTVTNQTFTNNSADFQIGRGLTTNYFRGNISDVAVYSGALSAARVAAHAAQANKAAAAADLRGVGSLISAGSRRQFPGATLAGIGTIGAFGVRRDRGAATLDGEGTLTADSIRRRLFGATLDGEGALTVTALKITPATAALTGVGTLTAATTAIFSGAALLAGEGFLRAGRQLVEIPPLPVDTVPVLVPAEQASPRLIKALNQGHETVVVVQVLDGVTGQILREITTVENGGVTLDASAAIRGRCDITLIDDGFQDLIPATPRDMLAPYGNELRIGRGVRFPDGTAEAVSLGVFRMRQVATEDIGSAATIHITGLDRWSRLVDARFEAMYVVPGGTNVITAIRNIAQDAWPGIPTDLGTTNYTTPQRIAERGTDRDAIMQDLARSIGSELYFDGTGTLVRRPIALATDNSRWIITEGDGGALLSAGRAWDSERVYNKVIASGEPLDDTPPVCAEAWDDNPMSPTYYHGPFGKRPRFYVSQMLTSTQQAADAAAGILAGAIGTSQQVSFEQLVDPTMEPGKVVQIMRERLGLEEKHVLDTLAIPLDARETMTARTRVTEVAGT